MTGDALGPANTPGGCRFHLRCPLAKEHRARLVPEWREVRNGDEMVVAWEEVRMQGPGGPAASSADRVLKLPRRTGSSPGCTRSDSFIFG